MSATCFGHIKSRVLIRPNSRALRACPVERSVYHSRYMPIIETKNIERLRDEDRLLYDAGNLVKAGRRVGNAIGELSKHKASVYRTITLSREEKARLVIDDSPEKRLETYVAKRSGGRFQELRGRLRETILEFHSPFDEGQSIFSLPGKKRLLDRDKLLENNLETFYRHEVAAGANRIVTKYKLKFALEILGEMVNLIDGYKPRELAQPPNRGFMPRFHPGSIRLNSKFDGGRFSQLGDAAVNQAIDVAILFLHTMLNINKRRIEEGKPLSEERFDPDKHMDRDAVFQYRKGLILDAATGILLHNIGMSHSSVHPIVSAKPIISPDSPGGKSRIRAVQKSINAARHLLEQVEVSSLARMMVSMQRSYPDGTGFPYTNANRFHHEFLRLFQIIEVYDQLTNPIFSPLVYSRQDALEYLESHSGPYTHNPHTYVESARFDDGLLREFMNCLAPYEIGEKVYLYDRGDRDRQLFVGKVHSYLASHIPLIAVLKDERRGREYKDDTFFLYIPAGEAWAKQGNQVSRKRFAWIRNLVIVDKGVDPADIGGFEDEYFGRKQTIAKAYR